MDGFKNSTKTSYDTASGRKFARGGMTVSRNDMAGGEGPMNKPAMVAKYAKGGVIKKGNGGGVFNEKGKRATLAEIAAEGRRMEGRKPPVEGISTRPTDDSGRRMTNKELGMTPGGVNTAKKKAVPSYSGKPMIRRSKGGLTAMPKGKC
jgi:hypothetical protein